MRFRLAVFLVMASCAPRTAHAQATAQQPARASRLVADTLHSKAIAANKYGDSPDRSVFVYLPPSYDSGSTKRYPVVYLLHGFGGSDRSWVRGYRGFSVQPSMDSLIAAGAVREMIVVMPNAFTHLTGSFYTNSAAIGNWEDLIARELVSYVDGKYRTLARADSRGLAGHSMGGYGTFTIGMHHAGDVYGALYSLSGCCTQFARQASGSAGAMWKAIADVPSLEASQALPFLPKVFLSLTAAFSPDTSRGPLFISLPFELRDGQWEPVPATVARWTEHEPYSMIAQNAGRLKRLRGFVFDVGTRDELVAPAGLARMDSAFTRAGVAHIFETYDGDHNGGIGVRMITKVLPFFSRTLDFSSPR